jgi:hypothetical protein
VLLSASVAAPDTPLSQLMGAVRSGDAEMVVCDQLLGEVERGLNSRYFRGRLTEEEREELPPVGRGVSQIGGRTPRSGVSLAEGDAVLPSRSSMH